jgi:hypothetical protein
VLEHEQLISAIMAARALSARIDCNPRRREHNISVTEMVIRVGELSQLFDAIDPSPFCDRDLDPRAEAFIVEWAKDLPRDEPLALGVLVDRPPADTGLVEPAVHQYFAGKARSARRRLRELFGRGRISLAIGLACLAAALAASKLVELWLDPGGMLDVVRVSLAIAGWVAMWRPMELFLYDWWPIRSEARLYDRLAAMPVRIKAPT